ncbi:hypothetical protein HDU96_001542 [Phlyctochytrium bullatum]|nr:hypothetical protein HDU96_001542 [Phlyctochytrium bullatum]
MESKAMIWTLYFGSNAYLNLTASSKFTPLSSRSLPWSTQSLMVLTIDIMNIKSLLRTSSVVILVGAFFPSTIRSAAIVRRETQVASGTMPAQTVSPAAPTAVTAASALGPPAMFTDRSAHIPDAIASAAAVPEITEPRIQEPGPEFAPNRAEETAEPGTSPSSASLADEAPADDSDVLAAQVLDPSTDDEVSPASTGDEEGAYPSAEPTNDVEYDDPRSAVDQPSSAADYPDDAGEAEPSSYPEEGDDYASPASVEPEDDENDVGPSHYHRGIPEENADAATFPMVKSSGSPKGDAFPKVVVPQQQHQRHHRRRRIHYSARARLSQRRLGVLRDQLRVGGKKGAKKMYGMTYYHKKTSYPTVGPVVNGTIIAIPRPSEDVTFKKVKAYRKSGAVARMLAQRIRALRLRKGIRAHRRMVQATLVTPPAEDALPAADPTPATTVSPMATTLADTVPIPPLLDRLTRTGDAVITEEPAATSFDPDVSAPASDAMDTPVESSRPVAASSDELAVPTATTTPLAHTDSPAVGDDVAAETPTDTEDQEPAAEGADEAEAVPVDEDASAAAAPWEEEDDKGMFPATNPGAFTDEIMPSAAESEKTFPGFAEVAGSNGNTGFLGNQGWGDHGGRRRRKLKYRTSARLTRSQLGLLRDRLATVGKKGSKKEYKMTYYHKKTSYPNGVAYGPIPGAPAVVVTAPAAAPTFEGSVAYYGNTVVAAGRGTPPPPPGVAAPIVAAPVVNAVPGYIPPGPVEDITYKKVQAYRKAGARAGVAKDRIRALVSRRRLRAHRKVKGSF